jgi:hypothetical protein
MNWKVPVAFNIAQGRTNSKKLAVFYGFWMPANGAGCVSVFVS